MNDSTQNLTDAALEASGGKGRLPWHAKALWGIGGTADNLIANTINAIVLPIYNIGMGVDPVLLGYAIAVPRMLDALTDSYVGYASDNSRTKWGRRRPFILVGALIASICCALMWSPPTFLMQVSGLGAPAIFWYFLIVTSVYYLGYAVFLIPFNALGFELSSDHHERTRVQAWRFFFLASAGFLLPWLYRLSIHLGNMMPVDGLKPEVAGVRWVGLGIALLILVTGALPAIFCREREMVPSTNRIGFWTALSLTLRNRTFLVICAAFFIIQASLFVVNPLSLYIWIYHVCAGDKEFASTLNGYMGTLNAVVGLLAIAPVTWAATRWGKRNTLLVGSCIALMGNLSTWLLFTPANPYWSIIPQQIMAPGLTCVYILSGSMLADICDLDEQQTGLRREGMYGAVFAFLFKCGFAVVTIITGYLLHLAGYSDGASPSAAVIWNLRMMFMLVPAVGILIGIGLILAYPSAEDGKPRSSVPAADIGDAVGT